MNISLCSSVTIHASHSILSMKFTGVQIIAWYMNILFIDNLD